MSDTTMDEAKFLIGQTPFLRERLLFGGTCGDLVKVRPCGDEYKGKTYLGVLIGEVARSIHLTQNSDDPTAFVIDPCLHNPAIFVPELRKVIFGYESWWGKIKSEDELKEITDEDIQNVWYVQMLKYFEESNSKPENNGSE